ncbi:restriction endonuclease subunit S [Bifidobacterium catenulatum subsp. kashiwanohense]|uniref:restriction endonuclease subunit S n=1 Tax=Bifidobacterium catenulatum TaxID=1686 RepID=UPI002480BB82|nr:restriction endonuclease subunit S [Bifidobacterium catenulatum]MDH7900824.1 restriction endonuclease subunit S [Bifidobacterium catenulatum subsp. kashiwanohense]
MSRIDDLIAEYCPDGVRHQTLGEIGEFIRGNGIQKRDFRDSGFGCIHYGQIYTYYGLFADHTKSFIDPNLAEKRKKAYKGDLVIATTSENEEDVCKACAWLGEEPIAISGDAYIFRHHQNPKYISYCFQSELFQSQKKKYITGTKVLRVNGDAMAKIHVPVPPLPVQEEIVRILDSFSSLEAELEARRKQYAYYRDQLIRDCPSIRWIPLSEISENCDKSRKPIKKEKRIAGKTPYYGASGVVDYVDGFTHEGDYLLLSEDGANLLARSMPIAYQISGRNWINSHAHVLRIENANLRQLVEMYLNSISLEPYITKGAQPKLTKQRMETIAVPVPSEDYLSRIVEMLTKFYALTTSLTDGLPAEIEARRKQYEYYRDRLLSFDELAV